MFHLLTICLNLFVVLFVACEIIDKAPYQYTTISVDDPTVTQLANSALSDIKKSQNYATATLIKITEAVKAVETTGAKATSYFIKFILEKPLTGSRKMQYICLTTVFTNGTMAYYNCQTFHPVG